MFWPAINVFKESQALWYLIFPIIVIESLILKYFLKTNWTKSWIASILGNTLSYLLGNYLMVYIMFLWHLVVDTLIFHATYNPINWTATFIFMFLGSVLLETFILNFMLKEKFKKLFIHLSIGNIIGYIIVGIFLVYKN
jgi:hypothetical protein